MGVVPSENVSRKKERKKKSRAASLLFSGRRSCVERGLGMWRRWENWPRTFPPKVRPHRAPSTNHRRERGRVGGRAVTSNLCPCGRVVTSPQGVAGYNAATGDRPVSREGVAVVRVLHNCSSGKGGKPVLFPLLQCVFQYLTLALKINSTFSLIFF